MNLTTAVVHFRTVPNGAYRYMRGLRRGYYRLLRVRNPRGSMAITSHNVVAAFSRTREGIEGVTPRSQYYISPARLQQQADAMNRASDAAFNRAVHRAE